MIKWTCSACNATGEYRPDDIYGQADAHQAAHTTGPYDIVPTLLIELV